MKITKNIFFAISLGLVASTGADEVKILKVGTKPESVCRGFGGKLYVTMINGNEPGDGEIKMIDGDKITVFAKGLNNPKGMAFVGGFLGLRRATLGQRTAGHFPVTDVAVGHGDQLYLVAKLCPLDGAAAQLKLGVIRMRTKGNDAQHTFGLSRLREGR